MRSSSRAHPVSAGVVGGYAAVSLVGALTSVNAAPLTRLTVAVGVTAVAIGTLGLVRGLATTRWRLAGIALVVGVLRGALLAWVVAALGIASQPSPLRILNSAVSAVVWIGVLATVLGSREAYRRRYALAVEQVAREQAADALAAHPDVAGLTAALDDAFAGARSDGDLRRAAGIVRAEIDERVRPLSHRVWFAADTSEPSLRIGRLLRDAVRTLPVPPLPTAAVALATGLAGAPGLLGAGRGPLSAVVSSACLYLALLVWQRVRRGTRSRTLGPVALVACAVLPVAVTHVVVSALVPEPVHDLGAVLGLAMLSLAGLMVAAAALTLASSDQARIVAIAESCATAASSRALSTFVHNSVQAELTGLALQLEHADPGSASARMAVERLGALASRSIADDFRAFHEAPVDRIGRLVAAWDGIAALSVVIDAGIDPTDPRLGIVVQVVEEATSNAVRHGSATAVAVTVGIDGPGLVVEVRTDGVVGEPAGPAATTGMGDGWLRAVAREPVAVEAVAGGTRMRLLL